MLQIQGLTKSYGGRVLLGDVSLKLPEGRKIALVGQNGAGKTTLLNIICGLEDADSGSTGVPKGRSIGYLPQEPNPHPQKTVQQECESGAKRLNHLRIEFEKALAKLNFDHGDAVLAQYEAAESEYRLAGGYSLASRATHILRGLGFSQQALDQDPAQMSGGYRMRLELAKIFLDLPDLLILDEPTNHLDLPSLVWVENWLHQYQGTVLFVSHDRDLLNRLASHTIHLHAGQLKLYTGNFDSFLQQREQQQEQLAAQRKNLEKRREEHEAFVDRFGAKASKARQAQSRLKMIAKLRSLENELPEEEAEQTMSLQLPVPMASSREVLKVEQLCIGYDPQYPLAEKLGLSIERGQKIAIIGANGIGKSTLIKTLTDNIRPLRGSFQLGYNVVTGYFAQDQASFLDPKASVLDNVLRSSASITPALARKILGGLLFRADDVWKLAHVLSGGEKNRLGLACLLCQNANMLFLDEPTNHLDMTSVEVLIDALSDYKGTMLFVSHDRTFINELATHIFVMLPGGRSELFIGNLEDYQRLAPERGFPNVLANDPTTVDAKPVISSQNPRATQAVPKEKESLQKSVNAESLSRSDQKAQQKERQKLEKLIQSEEQRQLTLKREIEDLHKQCLATDPANFVTLAKLNESLHEKEQSLQKSEDGWLGYQEQLERIRNS